MKWGVTVPPVVLRTDRVTASREVAVWVATTDRTAMSSGGAVNATTADHHGRHGRHHDGEAGGRIDGQGARECPRPGAPAPP